MSEPLHLQSAMHRLLALEGATPRSRYLPLLAARIHVLEQGTGTPLLLLHGGGGGAANWYRLFAPLAAAGHRVLAPDLPGFGLSGEVPAAPPLGLQAAHLLERLLDALGVERADVCGTSFGGLAALRLAQHFPGRVRRLVLLDTAGLAGGLPWRVAFGTFPLVHRPALRASERGTRWLLRTLLTSERLPPGHEEALVAYLVASARAHPEAQPAAVRAFVRGLRQREVCAASELARIDAPVLLLWGERDRFFPLRQARAAVRRFPSAELRVIERAGHSPNWESPLNVIAELVEFLK